MQDSLRTLVHLVRKKRQENAHHLIGDNFRAIVSNAMGKLDNSHDLISEIEHK